MTRKQALGVLGLAEGAKPEDFKRAYRRLAFALHPDLNPDNPNAGKDFQRLNEAYVLLSASVDAGAAGGRATAAGRANRAGRATAADEEREATEKARADARKAYEKARGRFDANRSGTAGAARNAGPPHGPRPAEERGFTDREDVLRDLLRDPFARRVFEDIYSQIRRDAERNGKPRPVRPYARAEEPGLVGSMVEGAQAWARRQIDEEQTVHFAGALIPGSRVRLQVSHGFLSKPQTIELTLPPEFEIGRPIRLKGLGKRIGKWRGDLYLKILAK